MTFLFLLLAACLALIGVLAILARIVDGLRAGRLRRARTEYAALESQYGVVVARARCPHRMFQLSQTGVPGVVTLTTKWCLLCGRNIGSARLRRTWYGHRWE